LQREIRDPAGRLVRSRGATRRSQAGAKPCGMVPATAASPSRRASASAVSARAAARAPRCRSSSVRRSRTAPEGSRFLRL